MTHRERLAPVDNAWLRMERDTNRMMIVGVLVLEGRVAPEQVARILDERLRPFRRFHQRVVEDLTGRTWQDDEKFDIRHHVKRARLPRPADKRALQQYVSDMASQPLDMDRPLWQYHVIEDFQGDTVLLGRYHHSMADGIALIRVLLSMTEDIEGNTLPAPEIERPAEHHEEGSGSLLETIFHPLSEAVEGSLRFSSKLWHRYQSLIDHPSQAKDYARIAGGVAAELLHLALLPDDSRTRFKGKPGLDKRVAWTDPLGLPEVKAVGRVLGCSVNDVLLAAVSGALRAYLLEKGDDPTGVELRAMIPVNLRKETDKMSMGNRFGLVALELPVGYANPLARLYEVKRRMEALKGSFEPPVSYGLLMFSGIAPKLVQDMLLDMLANKTTAVMTNVPGPQQARYFCGAKMKQSMFWVPQSGDIGMGVSILSYDGQVQFGLITDAGLVPDPERVIERFKPEFEKLLYVVLMEPWDSPVSAADFERKLAAVEMAERAATPSVPRTARKARTVRAAGAAKPPVAKRSAAPAKARTAQRGKAGAAPVAKPAKGSAARIPKRFRGLA